MKNIIIAPVGENIDALFIGIKEFPTERIYLISPKDMTIEANRVKKELARFSIPAKIMEIKGDLWEGTFEAIAEIKKIEKDRNLVVNVATGNTDNRCAATSAAFVNGLKAFSIHNQEVMLLPVLKFSYYKLLTDRKLKILQLLAKDKTCCGSLENLSKKTKMSLPLISYHVNGNLKSEGLKDLGLVETVEQKGRIRIGLTTLGRMLVKGYITQGGAESN